jgi:hypothetical protein
MAAKTNNVVNEKSYVFALETRETHYWLRSMRDSRIITFEQANLRLKEVQESIRILTAVVKTSQRSRYTKSNIQHSPFSIAKVPHA